MEGDYRLSAAGGIKIIKFDRLGDSLCTFIKWTNNTLTKWVNSTLLKHAAVCENIDS